MSSKKATEMLAERGSLDISTYLVVFFWLLVCRKHRFAVRASCSDYQVFLFLVTCMQGKAIGNFCISLMTNLLISQASGLNYDDSLRLVRRLPI